MKEELLAGLGARKEFLRPNEPELKLAGFSGIRGTRPTCEALKPFRLQSPFSAAGDQPQAIDQLVRGLEQGERDQVLLGVTGSGKTFTMASVIEHLQRPALVLAPNKTLAAQLYSEMKAFFPDNAVEYFVSYYDYYQPEAYVPRSDTYIEKESMINEQIDRMRHSATRAVLERDDVVIVASVSCIYGIGAIETYADMVLDLRAEHPYPLEAFKRDLVRLQYRRNDIAPERGAFRARGDMVEVFPVHLSDRGWRISWFGDEVESISEFDPLTGETTGRFESARIYPNSHFVMARPALSSAMGQIRNELLERVIEFEQAGCPLEAERIAQRTRLDLEMLQAAGMCPGIENYSRYLTGRPPGQPPPTLFEYLPEHALLFVDESHVAIGQLHGMFRGDFQRKATLAEFGFRLPSCVDNRPLRFEEWDHIRPQTIYVSATPGNHELEQTQGVFVEQVVRPTGLVDPELSVRPVASQVDDLMLEAGRTTAAGLRTLVTVLTKRMAEDLTEYLADHGIRVRYLHSDIDTIERIELIQALRAGEYDVLVGINLLREGLDIPECGLVAILDADKEGYLRSRTSLIQTIGRAARNVEGRVLLYADRMTDSLKAAMAETERRRERQIEHNRLHGIEPRSVTGVKLQQAPGGAGSPRRVVLGNDGSAVDMTPDVTLGVYVERLEAEMLRLASELEFEAAVKCRDELNRFDGYDLEESARAANADREMLANVAGSWGKAKTKTGPRSTSGSTRRPNATSGAGFGTGSRSSQRSKRRR